MGTLYIVATPIGNLEDITFRAIEVLKRVDYVLCEDTRVTGKLLARYGIKNKLVSFNEFNEDIKSGGVINNLVDGQSITLISDSGSPLISDPGYKLVRDAITKNIMVESIPGPSAAICALTVSGKPPDKFMFLGYLPKKEKRRKELLDKVKSILDSIQTSIIIYESPYRLIKTLKDIGEVFGDIEIAICRELTKLHEEVRREKVSASIDHFSKTTPRGEFTLVF